MEALLDRNANPFAKDADGDTPLHRAVYSGWVGICEAIVRRSPDTIASVDAAGRTPRQVADARRTVAPRGGRQHWDAVAALLRGAEEKAETVRYPHHSGGDGSGRRQHHLFQVRRRQVRRLEEEGSGAAGGVGAGHGNWVWERKLRRDGDVIITTARFSLVNPARLSLVLMSRCPNV